jgi:hypothetical protein
MDEIDRRLLQIANVTEVSEWISFVVTTDRVEDIPGRVAELLRDLPRADVRGVLYGVGIFAEQCPGPKADALLLALEPWLELHGFVDHTLIDYRRAEKPV